MCASRSYSKFENRVAERTNSNVAESNSCCDTNGCGSQYNIYVIQHKCPYCNNLVSPPLCNQHQPPPTPCGYYGGNCYPYPSPCPAYQSQPSLYPYNQQVRCSVNCNPVCCEPSAVMMKNKPSARKKCCILPGLDESQAECPCCKAGKCPCCKTGKECGKSYDDKSVQSDQSIDGSRRSRRRSSVSSSVQTTTKERGPSYITHRVESQEIRSLSRGRNNEGEARR